MEKGLSVPVSFLGRESSIQKIHLKFTTEVPSLKQSYAPMI